MKYTTDWEEIGLSNDFIFGKVMSDPELCKDSAGDRDRPY